MDLLFYVHIEKNGYDVSINISNQLSKKLIDNDIHFTILDSPMFLTTREQFKNDISDNSIGFIRIWLLISLYFIFRWLNGPGLWKTRTWNCRPQKALRNGFI